MTPFLTLADLGRGGLFSDGDWVESIDQDPSGEVRLTQLADVGVGAFRDRSNRRMREDQARRLNCTFLESEDVLIARMPDPLGRACLVPPGLGRAVTVVDVAILRVGRPDVLPRYVAWMINAPQFRGAVEARQSGTTRKRISRKNLATLRIPVPPLEEQRRIVAILEEHLTSLDAANASLATAQLRAAALVKSALIQAVPDVDDYPWHWIASTVGEAGRVELGRQRHPDWHTGPNERPYLRVANVFEDRIDTSDVMTMDWPEGSFERFRLLAGQILLNEGQSPQFLGRPAMYRGEPPEVAFTNSLLRFTAADGVLPEFALLVFRRHMHAGRFQREARITTNIAHLSASRLKPIEFPIPPVDEQAAIVAAAHERLAGIQRLRDSLSAQQRRGAGLRRALLAAAFSGRLTGRASDSDVIETLADQEAS